MQSTTSVCSIFGTGQSTYSISTDTFIKYRKDPSQRFHKTDVRKHRENKYRTERAVYLFLCE